MKMRHRRKQFWLFPKYGVFMKAHSRKIILRKIYYVF